MKILVENLLRTKKRLIKILPTFEYHPNVYDNGIVDFKVGICDCCGKTVKAMYRLFMQEKGLNVYV